MDVNSRDPSQNIIPFRIKGVDIARFDISGNLGIGTTTPTAKLDIAGGAKISGNTVISGTLNIINNTNNGDTGITLNGIPIENKINSAVVINMDSQPAPATALNRQKKQSIPLAVASTLSTSDVIAKMSGVSVGKSQTYGVGPAQMASYGNIVVAVGLGTNSIAYSLTNPPTASSWVGIPNSANTFTTQGRNIAYANGTWVAVGDGTNSIAYSTMTPPVASSWVGVPTGTSINGVVNTFNTGGYDIAYGNGAWVAVGTATNSIAYSLSNPPTAESWVGIPLSFSPTLFGTNAVGITFGNGTWVATGEGTNGIAYSTRTPPTSDSWVVVPLTNTNDASIVNTFGQIGWNVAFANGVWLAAGQVTNTLCYSVENPPIAGSWMPITTGILFGTSGRSLAYGNGTWVACGNSGTLLAYSTSRIPHSSSWVSMKGPTPSSSGEIINHITFNAATNTWYFTGDIGTNCMFYSTATPPVPATWVGIQRSTGAFTTQAFGAAGITTNAFTSPINVARLDNKVSFPANRMLAVGGGGTDVLARSALTPAPATTGTISYSDDDGATWAMVPGGATNTMFSSAADISANTSFGVGGSRGANAVAWNGEKWVAAGNGRTNSLAFSDDGGMTWTGVTGKSIFSVEARDVAWNGQMWVAVGRGAAFSTAYSYDGVTWMGPVDTLGAPINVFSLDIAGPSASMSDILGGGNRVVWSGKMWVATGTRTLIAGSSPAAYYTIAYSTDGKTWTGVPESGATSTGFDMYAHGVAWNGRNYVATGRGTVNTLVTFTDAAVTTTPTTWQGLGNTVFSVWGRGITWGAKRWMATGRGTNTVAYSTNGRNWQGCGANVFKPMRRFMAMGDAPLYTTVPSGQPQRGVAFSYSDDGVTWDAPVVNQGVEFFDQSTPLYSFTTHTFNNADKTGRTGPTLQEVKTKYLTTDPTATWTQDARFLNMGDKIGIQLWQVPVTGVYRIRAVGAAAPTATDFGGRGIDITTTTTLIKGEIIQILVGQRGVIQVSGGGGGGTFVVRGTQTPIIVAGGGGGPHYSNTYSLYSIPSSDASSNTSGNSGVYNGTFLMAGGTSGGGGVGGQYGGGGGGLTGNGGAPTSTTINTAGNSFISDGLGGLTSNTIAVGGFGGGAGTFGQDGGGGGGGGYSGGGAQSINGVGANAGGGGGSFAISTMTVNGYNTVAGSVTMTLLTTFGDSLSSSTLFTNNILLTNAVTDTASAHTGLMFSADGGASWARVPGTSDTEANGGTGMTVANGGSYSLAGNPARTRFLVGGGDGGSATRKVYFSNDGFNWRNGVSSPNSTQMAWVYASLWVGGIYNRWLIGGNDATTNANGRIMRSLDADAADQWTSSAVYINSVISCFAANTDFSVILAGAASGNKIYRSTDGGNSFPTTIDITSTPTGSVTSIAFSPSLGRWVAVGGGAGATNTIIYSTDATATAWIAPPAQAKTAATAIFKNGSEATRVIWDAVGGRFIVGGWNGAASTAALTNVFGLDATLNNNPGYTMAYSADGINWTPVTVQSSDAGASVSGPFLTRCREIMALDTAGDFTPINTGYSVTWNSYANRFVATGNGTCPVVYSNDGGVTWTPANQQPQQQAIAVAGGASAAAGTTSVSPLTYTIDGKTWSQGVGAKEIFGTGAVNAVEYGQTSTAVSPNGGRIWVAGGTHTSGTSCLAFSQNGIRWTAITGATTMMTNVRTIAYAPSELLSSSSNAAITAGSGVGNGVWVAGGDTTNSLIFSYDGISWSEVPNSLTVLSRCNAIAFGNGLFVAGGVAATGSSAVDTTANLVYSTDGINWVPIRSSTARISAGASISSIAYGRDENGRGLWVAGATTATSSSVLILYSYNGMDWVGVINSGGTVSLRNINNATLYSPHVYLDATNPSSYNSSTNTWTNIGSLGGNVVMTNMGTFDVADNGGSFNFNGSTNRGQITVPSTPLTSVTYLAVVKTTGVNTGYATIIDFGEDTVLFATGLNILRMYNPSFFSGFTLTAGVWYVVAATITTGGAITFYVNGVSVYTTTGAIISTTNTVYGIGGGVGGNEYWSGKISALAIYHNRVLNENEIQFVTQQMAAVTSIAYGVSASMGRGLWVATVHRSTADGNSFVFSTNGRDGWTAVPNTKAGLFEPTNSGPTGIAYLNGVWYATGSSAGISTGRTLAYSYDGSGGWFGVYPTTNLYGASVTTFSLTDMRCVATTNDYIIPSGASAGSAVSSGTAAASFQPASMKPVRSIGWTAGVGSAYLQHPTLLFGADGVSRGAAISADGGRTWGASTVSLARSAFRGGVCNDAFWNGTLWGAVGHDAVTGSKVATSKDGVTWTQTPASNVPIAGVLNAITWNGSVWMVGGDGAPINDANTASIAWSADLMSWNGILNTDISLTVVKRIAWNGMYWVAVGQGGANATTIMYSKNRNGLVWEDTFTAASGSTAKTSTITTAVNDVVWGGGRWVAVGRGNSVAGGSGVSILYSVDTPAEGGNAAEYAVSGRRWVGVASSAQLFPYGANSVSWNGKRFIATGPAADSSSTSNIIAWSADGISWNAYSSAKTVAPGQRWVAVGSGSRACIALSADGRVWTDVAGTAALFSDISGASAALVSTMKTGARAVGWNGSSLIVGGARAATTMTETSQFTATSTIGRTTIPVCAFIGSGNGVLGGGTTNVPDASVQSLTMRTSSSVFITHMDVNMREASAPWANMWLNTYTDLSATQLFQVTPESQTFSSALKWNGWSWVANFGMTTNNPVTGEQYGSIWYCTDPLARVGWSVASNSANPRILIGQGGYAALEWNGVAWLACGNDPNNNNLIYTTDKYGAIGWTAVSGIVSGGSASFLPVCIASSSRFWVVGGSQGTTSAMYFTSDRTGATGWRAISTTGGGNVLPGIRISSVAYNGGAWICCGGGGGGSGAPASSISWSADTGADTDIGTGWAAAGVGSGIPPVLSNGSAVIYNTGAASPMWVVVGNVTSNTSNQIAYTTTPNGSTGWNIATGTLTDTTFGRLNGIAWTGYSWIATSGAGASRILNTTDITAATEWNSTSIFSPTISTNAVAYVNIPISLLTTGMATSAGAGAGTGAMWRAGAGRAQGLLPSGGTETTAVVVRSSNGAQGTTWSQTYSRNFLIAVGGGAIRDANNGGGANRMAYSYDGGLSWTTNTSTVLTNAVGAAFGTVRTVKYGNGIWVAGGDSAGSSVGGNNCLAWSRDGVNWVGAGGTQIFGSAGACYAVCCNDRGRWVAVGGSPLTTAGTYTNTSGAIYTMAWSDDGQNWTPILGSRALFGIVCQGVSYGTDASGVGMWTAIGRGSAYTGCAYSYDGKTWFLSQTSGSLFGTSANVLTERYAPLAGWQTVAINSNGQIQFAGANAGATGGGLVWRSMDYGVSWSALTLPPRNWVSVAVSSTGQYVIAASSDGATDRLYNSSDYGVTWVGRGLAFTWKQVAISASGQYQVGVAPDADIVIFRDYGVTFQVPTSGGGAGDKQAVAISSSGQYITVVGTGQQVKQSSDYGVTFTDRSTAWQWRCVAMSSTGQIQIGSSDTYNIYVSINYGVDWTVSNAPSPSVRYRSVAISSTGQYRSGVTESTSETIKRSNNYDAGWTAVGATTNYFAIAMSSTGQYQTAVSQTASGLIYISSNFGETWSAAATDSRSLGVAYGKDANGTGMWVATAGRRDRDVAATAANTMAYSYDGKLWRGIRASAGLSEQAWSVAYGKDGFGVGMWVAAGYDTHCGLKWSYDGVNWNASMGASGAAVWVGAAAGRRALSVYWNGSMWLASTSDTRNGEPRGTGIAANNASSVTGYLLYSYNGKNWLPVLAPNTYAATISASAQPSVYSVLPNPAILDFGSFYDDQAQRGVTIANTTARTVGAIMSGVPVENVNTIVPYGKGSLTTGQVPFLMGGDSGLVETGAGVVGVAGAGAPPVTSELASTTASLSTSTDGGITWRAVPNSTRVMTKVNKILCDETTQQIVAVGTGNYSVATSTPATAANADGWVGVFGSRMTDTRAGLFEKYGTGASWFGGAKMWIASGRAQTRRGSSLAVSVNGTVWQDAKIVSQMAAGSAGAARGGGLVSRTTTSIATLVTGMNSQDGASAANNVTVIPGDALYDFSSFTFNNAGKTGRTGPDLTTCRTYYAANRTNAAWAQDPTNNYLNMTTNGIQSWTVPATGSYKIRAVGAAGGNPVSFCRGIDVSLNTILTKGDVIKILVGQQGITGGSAGGGGGGSFVVKGTSTAIIVAGGGGGNGAAAGAEYINSNATSSSTGNKGADGSGTNGNGGINGAGGEAAASGYGAAGGGLLGSGSNSTFGSNGGSAFTSGGLGGLAPGTHVTDGGFGGGGSTIGSGGGGGGGGYSGGGGTSNAVTHPSGGGGGSYGETALTVNGSGNTGHGSVTITANFTISLTTTITVNTPQTSYPLPTLGGIVPYNYLSMTHTTIPYTSAATPLLTYTDSAAAFSTQVSSVAVNTQYNRAVVGGSGVQFVAGGRGAGSNGNGLAYSNDGQNWTAAAAGAATVFQTPTNVAAYSTAAGSGGFDASFGTVALTQRMTTPTTYPSGGWRSVSLSKTGQYQTAVVNGGNIWTSSDYGVTWTSRATVLTWRSVSLSSSGQYQTAVVSGAGNIWTSSDYGVTWTPRTNPEYLNYVSLSSTGQYQSVAASQSANGWIWTSSDYGVTWTARTTVNLNWWSISLSATGQYQSAVLQSGNIYISSDFGANWTPQTAAGSREWRSISLSSTGQYQSAVVESGNIWTSLDYGLTWTSRATSLSWQSVSLSSTGQYQSAVATSGNIWTSYDFGVTWTQRTAPGSSTWYSVSLSATGQYQSATVQSAGGNIYTSTNYGATWVQRSTATTTKAFTRIRSSASGQYQLATAGPVGNTNGQFYVSSDYGQTWIPRRGLGSWLGGTVSATGAIMMTMLTPTAATATLLRSTDYGNTFSDIGGTTLTGSAYWRAIAATNSAQFQTAVANGGSIYRSFDTGLSWTNAGITIDGSTTANTTTPRNWMDAAVSAETGLYQLTCISGGYIYYSTNRGDNWISSSVNIDGVATQTTNRTWQAVANSADGQYGLACANSTTESGFLYRSENFGSTWISNNIVIEGGGLQQLTNRPWQDVGMSANGKYQVACINSNTQTQSISSIQSAVSIMVPPPGALTPTYGVDWAQRGADIDGEAADDYSGHRVAISADGTTVAIGAILANNPAGTENTGHVRVYKYNPNKLTEVTDQTQSNFGPVGWDRLGRDIDGEAGGDYSGWSVALSADGTTVAIGAVYANNPAGTNDTGHVRVYKYNPTKLTEVTDQTLSNFGPVGWDRMGRDIDGEAADNYSGWSVAISADGTTVAIGAPYNNNPAGTAYTGHVRVYKYNPNKLTEVTDQTQSNFGPVGWDRMGRDIDGEAFNDQSGYSVALSADGTTVAIGAYAANNSAGDNNTGHVRVYKYNPNKLTEVTDQTLSNFGPVGWDRMGRDIDGKAEHDYSGWSVAISADGTTVAIGAPYANNPAGTNDTGHVRVYKYNPTKLTEVTDQTQSNFGPVGWDRMGRDIDGEAADDQSGWSVALSADGTTVAIGALYANNPAGTNNTGHVRVYKYNPTKLTEVTDQTQSNFGPVGWDRLGRDIDGEAFNDQSGYSVAISADGTTVAIGARYANTNDAGHVRVYKIPVTNAITYTSATSSVADIFGNLLIIKSNGTSAITATQGATTTNGSLVVSGTSYTLTYTIGTTSPTSYIYYSKNYGSSWSILDNTNSRAWSSVAISDNGSTISATASDSSGAILTYSMPDDQYYRAPALTNSGSTTTTATVRAITYGNSGTGAATDGYWVAGADASANSLAYSSNGMDWTAVVGSKTTLFNAVNGVAYGADALGTPMWVAVGRPFVGSVLSSTAYSIAYSYNMTTWVGVRNAANFTGQGNHVAYGQDEFGAGVWVAVGQADDTRAFNLGNSSFGNSNGTAGTTIFYSYDGANWAAGTGTGIFAVSGTDVTWGVDASGVATWVATGVGFTDPLTGVFNSGGQVAHSLNGRAWTLISQPTAIIAPTITTLSATTRGYAMVAPSASSTGFINPTYNNIWRMLGADIDGEAADDYSGSPVSMSADGTVVAIGAYMNDGSGNLTLNSGHVCVYKYNPNKSVAQFNQSLPGFGPAGWDRLGGDIDGEASLDESGYSVSLSADGTTVAIGATGNNNTAGATDTGHVRVYKYNPNKVTEVIDQTQSNFGPAGWDRVGGDIDGEVALDQSGYSVSLSADGNVVAIGSILNDAGGGINDNRGHVRVYNYNPDKTTTPVKWEQLGADIDGEAASDQSGWSLALSADGTTVAIGGYNNAGIAASAGHVRVYKYTPGKGAVTVQTDLSFGPAGWTRLGADIDGEAASDQSGYSVALSVDGTVVAIGSISNAGTAASAGHVRVYKYTLGKGASTNQTDSSFGPIGWTRLGADIDGEAGSDKSGMSVALSADGTIVAIGAEANDGPTTNTSDDRGHVRIYKYNPAKIAAITDQSLPNFGPAGWDRIGVDIDGEAPADSSGRSVSLSADGTTLAIGAPNNDGAGSRAGHVRVYKLDTYGAITYTSSNPAVADIYGNALLLIKDISDGVTTITATQAAVPPFTLSPITVQGTITVIGKTTRTLVYNSIVSTYSPFSTSAITVAYGRNGSQGTGAPRWIVGGSGGNVFAMSSRPTATTTGAWSVVSTNDAAAPFSVCNSLAYSNGVWVAANNTDATNVLARSIDGGATWTPVTASSVSGIIAGSTAIGANAFCNYSLAVADYSNDTNLRSWNAVQGTKNFMFDGGVNSVATVTPNIVTSTYNGTNRAWWVAGGRNQIPSASIAYTLDPSGATGWTLGTSTTANGGNGIGDLAEIRDITFSPHTQQWLAVGVGSPASPTMTALYSDISGIAWTSAVVSSTDASLNLNTCAWNQLDVSASAAGRWLVGGRSGVDASSVSLFISSDVTGQNWTPIAGTGAILSQVYSLAYNGRVWIAAGSPATGTGSTSTLMRTTDPTGATGWQGIAVTNISTSGFDTAARSVTWNADQNMWVATGENTGTVADASFSSVIYSLDVTGSAGTWRTVRESNSVCFSGEGTGIAFTGDKWLASGEGNNQIVATTGSAASAASTASWTPIAHGTALTRASDIAYTGSRLIATGAGTGSTNGVILSTDNSGGVWSAAPATPGPAFTDALGGATSITFEASYEGVGRVVATGRSATNSLSVSTDGGATWSAPSVQYSTLDASSSATTQPLFTTGGNSVAYVGNDTLFSGGGNDVQWNGKRWIATGRNSAVSSAVSSTAAPLPDIINNNTSAVATSDDGITWQCVSSAQAPNLSEGTFLASNPRIGATPLINSQIVIADGGDTEASADYGGMVCDMGGSGTGVAQIDIIAELTPVSTAASSVVSGAVGILGAAGNGGSNGVGNAPAASFDNTAFTITTRPM